MPSNSWTIEAEVNNHYYISVEEDSLRDEIIDTYYDDSEFTDVSENPNQDIPTVKITYYDE